METEDGLGFIGVGILVREKRGSGLDVTMRNYEDTGSTFGK